MMPLSKGSTSSELKKDQHQSIPPKEHSPPPVYTVDAADPPDLTAAFANLKLNASDLPTPDHCIAHLKLLEAFHQLREVIALQNGLFKLSDSYVPSHYSDADKSRILTQIRDKRWSIYVAKAARRFECWWEKCVQPDATKADWHTPMSETLATTSRIGQRSMFEKTNLPPLDVIMVWHAYQLNPRDFFEDSIRHGKMDFWRAGLPWAAIDACINNETFEFETPVEAVKAFVVTTELPWDSKNDKDPNRTLLRCPGTCNKLNSVPWTTCDSSGMWHKEVGTTLQGEFQGSGLTDKNFRARCSHCGQAIDHDSLKLRKFGEDIMALEKDSVPMPGTILSLNGKPEQPISLDRHPSYFPNRLICGGKGKSSPLYQELIRLCPQSGVATYKSEMMDVRDVIEKYLRDRSHLKLSNHTYTAKLQRAEKIALRRMMSHYWNNSSPFALDLVGAVIRQGTFIEKMHSIDWIHSPACAATMKRLITKYTRYIQIIASYPDSVAVPTLDVDLAWHTHQLSPPAYYTYTVKHTRTFIDHDDKIDETKLSTSFEWTSKTYQKMFNEVYSECTCWYCEAIRESHTSALGRVFSSSTKAIDTQLDQLHSTPQAAAGLDGPHISAHNAIKPEPLSPSAQAARESTYRRKLEKHYLKTAEQARKRGRAPPSRDAHANAYMAYGYPMYVPYYAPYMGDPCIAGGMYASNPSCASFVPGAAGNCCQGSCGGGVAAGACGGSGAGGGCAAGSSGGGCGGGGGVAGGCGGGGGGGGGGARAAGA